MREVTPFNTAIRFQRENAIPQILRSKYRKLRKHCICLKLYIHVWILLLNIWLCLLKGWLCRFYFYIHVCMCVYMLIYATCMPRNACGGHRRILGNLFSFYPVVGSNQVISIGSKSFYSRRHFSRLIKCTAFSSQVVSFPFCLYTIRLHCHQQDYFNYAAYWEM